MRFLSAALAAALAACSSGERSARQLPDIRLSTLGGPLGGSLASCPTDKCLTVLVAPWCGVCRAEAPNIKQFRRYLDQAGISSRVIIGLSDDRKAIRQFAALFGPDALLDDEGKIGSRATPLFLVTDRQGRVLKTVGGFPNGLKGPAELAHYLDLI